MKMLTIETILKIKKEINIDDNYILDEMTSNYIVSSKVNKITKKKNLLNKINYDLVFQNFEGSKFDNKFKNILICLNRLSQDNLNQVIDELEKITIDDFKLLDKVADFLCKKSVNETNFANLYILLINHLSECSKWIVKFDETKIISIKEALIFQLQMFYENQILHCDKDTGSRFFKFLSKVYEEKWISEKVFESIINSLLEDNKYEFIIVFLKGCKFEKVSQIKQTLIEKNLPMRLKFLIEEI